MKKVSGCKRCVVSYVKVGRYPSARDSPCGFLSVSRKCSPSSHDRLTDNGRISSCEDDLRTCGVTNNGRISSCEDDRQTCGVTDNGRILSFEDDRRTCGVTDNGRISYCEDDRGGVLTKMVYR